MSDGEVATSRERTRHDSGTRLCAPVTGISLELVVGDITAQSVDAIVTATGHGPRGRSLVELAVRRRAGPGLEAEYEAAAAMRDGVLPVGVHIVTSGHALSARQVIHCRPPSYEPAFAMEAARTLGGVVRSALARANEEGAVSVAIASLGTGAYGFPSYVAAPTTIAEIARSLSLCERTRLVRVVTFGPRMLTEYAEAAMRVLPSFVPMKLPDGGLRVALSR